MPDAIRVLHVDDDPAFLEMSAEFLSGQVADFDVATATGVDEGLERLAAGEFDCVVSDYQMPECDGLSFLEAVRERDSHLPFILFTGQGSEAVAGDAVTMGATDYLQKGPGSDPYRLLANRIGNAVESHRAQRELRQYRTLVETVGDAMYVLAEDGTVTLANQAMAAMLETDRETVVGTHAGEFMAEGDFERGTDLIVEILGNSDRNWGTFEMTVLTTTGEEIPGEINVAPIISDGEYQGTVGVVRDVRDRRERAKQLELYETAVESTRDGVAVLDASGEYLLVNREFADAYGLDKGEVVGTSALTNEVARQTDAPPDLIERYEDAYGDASESGTSQFRFESAVEVDGSEETFENMVTATRQDDGSVVFVTSTRHITERKEREQELERQNDRLEEFARVVSHDLRTPLGVASGRLELAADDCDSEHLAAVESALHRMDDLIDETLAMARQGRTVSETEPVDLEELLTACWEAIDPVEATISIESTRTIHADRGRFRRVVENLFRNAVEHGSTSPRSSSTHEDAVEHGSTSPRSSSTHEDAVEQGDEGVSVRVGTVPDGIFVADDGPGIPVGEREDVLEPGYTTSDEGTGFGLAIVSEIVEAHGWKIEVGESDASGARFEITGMDVG